MKWNIWKVCSVPINIECYKTKAFGRGEEEIDLSFNMVDHFFLFLKLQQPLLAILSLKTQIQTAMHASNYFKRFSSFFPKTHMSFLQAIL